MGTKLIEILVADNHKLVRDGLSQILNGKQYGGYQFKVSGEAASGRELLDICAKIQPDVIITDIALNIKSGFDVLKELKSNKIKSKLIFYTYFQNIFIIHKSFQLGASAFIKKNGETVEVLAVLDSALNNKRIFPDISRFSSRLPDSDFYTGLEIWEIKQLLTIRELEVFKHFGFGLCIDDTADSLNVCRKSIEYHQGNIKYKLKLKNQYELIKIASRFNLLDEM